MDYRKLIKKEIAKLYTAKGVKANPILDSDLGEQIVADICKNVVKNCCLEDVKNQKELLLAFEIYLHDEYGESIVSGAIDEFIKHINKQ